MNDGTLADYVTAVLEGRLATAEYLYPYLEPADMAAVRMSKDSGVVLTGVIDTPSNPGLKGAVHEP